MPDDQLQTSLLRARVDDRTGESDAPDDDPDPVDRKPVADLDEHELVERFEGLVGSIAQRIWDTQNMDVPFEDVRAYGFEGLLEAHDNYDPDRGVSFSSFAYYRIRGAIFDGFRKEGWSTRHQAFDVDDKVALNDHMADHAEVRAHLPRTKTFRDSIDHIDKMVGDTVTILLMRHFDLQDLETTAEAEQLEDVDRRQKLRLVRQSLEDLSDNEREVVLRHHFKGHQLNTIADDLGYSKSWVSRINSRAIDKIRDDCLEKMKCVERRT